jgi:hypothetical protein
MQNMRGTTWILLAVLVAAIILLLVRYHVFG